jgi:hypothetical protein
VGVNPTSCGGPAVCHTLSPLLIVIVGAHETNKRGLVFHWHKPRKIKGIVWAAVTLPVKFDLGWGFPSRLGITPNLDRGLCV